jgi:hypothetical protein
VPEPEDIAYAMLYLASDESEYMTDSKFLIDGDIIAQWGSLRAANIPECFIEGR